MNINETAKVLAKIQLVDNRDIDDLVLREWHDVIGGLDYEAAIEAVREHRATSTDYLVPAHVVAGAQRALDRRAREERKRRPAIAPQVITLDRQRFERETAEAIEEARRRKAKT